MQNYLVRKVPQPLTVRCKSLSGVTMVDRPLLIPNLTFVAQPGGASSGPPQDSGLFGGEWNCSNPPQNVTLWGDRGDSSANGSEPGQKSEVSADDSSDSQQDVTSGSPLDQIADAGGGGAGTNGSGSPQKTSDGGNGGLGTSQVSDFGAPLGQISNAAGGAATNASPLDPVGDLNNISGLSQSASLGESQQPATGQLAASNSVALLTNYMASTFPLGVVWGTSPASSPVSSASPATALNIIIPQVNDASSPVILSQQHG